MTKRRLPTMNQILESKHKFVDETYGFGGVLAKLFRSMLKDRQVSMGVWNRLVARYMTDPTNRIHSTRRDHTSARGNLMKEFSKPQMTWKVFCKAMKFMQCQRFELHLTVYDRAGKPWHHQVTGDLRNTFMDESELDDEEDEENRPAAEEQN